MCAEQSQGPDCRTDPIGDALAVTWLGNDRLAYLSEVMGDRADGDEEATPDTTRIYALDAPAVADDAARRASLSAEVEGPLDQLTSSPDGRYLLYGLSTGEAHVLDLASDGTGGNSETGEARRLADKIDTPAWSADGERLVFVNNGNVMSARVDGSGVKNLTHVLHQANVATGDPSPPADAVEQAGLASSSAPTPTAAAWSPDPRHIAFVADSDTVSVMNADGTGWTEIADTHGSIEAVTWTPSPCADLDAVRR